MNWTGPESGSFWQFLCWLMTPGVQVRAADPVPWRSYLICACKRTSLVAKQHMMLSQQKTSPLQPTQCRSPNRRQPNSVQSPGPLNPIAAAISTSRSLALPSALIFSVPVAARNVRERQAMQLARLQRPFQRVAGAVASASRPLGALSRPTTTSLEDRFASLRIASPTEINAAVQGKRYATVKSQGAYKLKSKKTIPKKLGAKRTGGTFSLPAYQ